ncbi:MAG: dihydroxy-acid dehydratase [Asticcacaulis sp.]
MTAQTPIRQAPASSSSGFAILHGTLAPEGCVVRLEGFDTEIFDGPARVFGSSAEALAAIRAGRVRSCDIMIIRHDDSADIVAAEGLDDIRAALADAGADRVTVITDGRTGAAGEGKSGGAFIGNVAPSAASRGPIAYVNDDDIIHIDIAARRIDVLADIDMRRSTRARKPARKTFGAGALEKYARLVTSVTRDGQF